MALRTYFLFVSIFILSFNSLLASNKTYARLCQLVESGDINKVKHFIKKKQGKIRMACYEEAIRYAKDLENDEMLDSLYLAKESEIAKRKSPFKPLKFFSCAVLGIVGMLTLILLPMVGFFAYGLANSISCFGVHF